MKKDRRLWIIFLIVFVNFLGYGIVFPLLPYYAEHLGASPIIIGAILAAYSICQFLSTPILGDLSDKIGRRPVLIFSLAGTVLSFFLLGIANTVWLVFVARIIDGLSGGNVSTAQAYIADITDRKDRTQAMGTISAALWLGIVFGPVIAGFLSRYGYSAPAFFAAAVTLVSAVLAFFMLPETVNVKIISKEQHRKRRPIFSIKDFSDALTHPEIGSTIVLFFLVMLAFSSIQGAFPLFTEHQFHIGSEGTGYLFAVVGLISVVTQMFGIRFLLKLFSEKALVGVGIASLLMSFIVLGTATNVEMLIVALVLLAFGSSVTQPVLTSLVSQFSTTEEQGTMLGVFRSGGAMDDLRGRLPEPLFWDGARELRILVGRR